MTAFGTGVAAASTSTTDTLRSTTADGVGTLTSTNPVSGIMVVTTDPCRYAPLGNVPPLIVNVTGPVARLASRTVPVSLVTACEDLLLLNESGKSGAVHRISAVDNKSPAVDYTVMDFCVRTLRVPVATFIGMKSGESVAPVIASV